jgi:3-oxoacyl-[acyl-carrier protein] reductase
MDLELTGRHVFVAGASRGIGQMIARSFLNEGANVTLTGRRSEPLDETASRYAEEIGGDRVFAKAGDMTVSHDILAALDAAEHALGPVDCVIANVGGTTAPMGVDLADDAWDAGIAQNFLGSMRLMRETIRRTLANGVHRGFNIVAISSIAGSNALGTPLTYGTQKAALNFAVRDIAKFVGRHGIRVNAVAPGNIIFPGGTWERRQAERPDAWTRWLEREVALRRFGNPTEIADVVTFMASPRASFVTGAVWLADGGQVK